MTDRYNLREALLKAPEKIMKTKGRQTGYIRRRGSSFIVQYSEWKEHAGQLRYAKTTATLEATNISDARTEAAAIVAKANSQACPVTMATIADFVEVRFRPDHVETLTANGKRHYEYLLKTHILPAVGTVRLREVTPGLIQALLNSKRHLSGQTVAHVRNALSAIFRHAKRLRMWSGELPTEDLKMPRIRPVVTKQALTWEQVNQIANHLPERLSVLTRLLALTGLRIGEAAALRWDRVNLTAKPVIVAGEHIPPYQIAVRESYSHGAFSLCKTQASRRNVVIPDSMVTELRALPRCSEFVFAGPKGAIFNAHNESARLLKPAAEAAGLHWVSWHTYRHTFATLADLAGYTASEKRLALGHTTDSMSLHYSHAALEPTRRKLQLVTGERRQNVVRRAG
jgi:integrase